MTTTARDRPVTQKGVDVLERSAIPVYNAVERPVPPDSSARRSVLLGDSFTFRDALRDLPAAVPSPLPVLLVGETGTGKDLVARKLHQLGDRRSKPFIAQNCAALPHELFESELFGHAAGAFTGATAAKAGVFEAVNGGTLLLDEVAELAPPFQAKLLRVLEDKRVRRVGETAERAVDFRLVCATNRELFQEVEEGRFRRDLFYRVNAFTFRLPPLRERPDDIPELARHFIAEAAAELDIEPPELHGAALQALCNWPWPGNVRELQNVLGRATALARDRPIVARDLGPVSTAKPDTLTLSELRHRFDREVIGRAIASHDGNITAAARSLGVSRTSLGALLRKHHLPCPKRMTTRKRP